MTSLFEALQSAPNLSGALCKGRWDLFDETTDPELIERATHICASCPAATACAEWLDSLPKSQRPCGVVAGRLHRRKGAGS